MNANTLSTQTADSRHVYRVTRANRIALVIVGTMPLILIAILCLHHSPAVTVQLQDILPLLLLFLGGAYLCFIRPRQLRITITATRVDVTNGFATYTIPFVEITGCRKYATGMFLYRRTKSRVWIPERSFQLDDFYAEWRASIYDLDKAERLQRKAEGKEHSLDWFATDGTEQHPAIGGPHVGA